MIAPPPGAQDHQPLGDRKVGTPVLGTYVQRSTGQQLHLSGDLNGAAIGQGDLLGGVGHATTMTFRVHRVQEAHRGAEPPVPRLAHGHPRWTRESRSTEPPPAWPFEGCLH